MTTKKPFVLQPRFLRLKLYVSRIITGGIPATVIARFFRNTIPYRGVMIHVGGAGLTSRVKASIFWGLYESAECRFVEQHLLRGVDVIELGSGIGAISSHVARRLRPGCRLICVEANTQLVSTLKKNLLKHGSHLHVQCINRVIAYGDDECEFTISDDHLRSSISQVNMAVSSTTATRVAATRLIQLIDESGLRAFQLIADIEGAEALICQHDAAALSNCRQIIIELHEVKVAERVFSVKELVTKFGDLGFSVTAAHGPVVVFRRASSN